MEQVWIIIGWLIVLVMIGGALRLFLSKPQLATDSTEAEWHIEPQSEQPIVPRHLRNNLTDTIQAKQANDATTEDMAALKQAQPVFAQSKETLLVEEQTIDNAPEVHAQEQKSAIDTTPILDNEVESVSDPNSAVNSDTATNEPEVVVSSNIENSETEAPIIDKVAVDTMSEIAWADELNVLDAHLSEQNRQDEESALATAEKVLALYVYPNPSRALSGDRALKILLKYGLRYGEMSCFHRYQHLDQPSPLMFSVLRLQEDGTPTGFDLEALPSEEVKGLAFFLALPSAHAVTGFDMMTSLAKLIARDVDGMVFDEQSLELTPQLCEYWRHFVIEYRSESV